MIKKLPGHFYFLIAFLILAAPFAYGQTDGDIPGVETIAEGETREYNNLILSSNNSHLIVNGTLIVYGTLNMKGNDSQFTMGSAAVVIVYGDFLASNKVDISISSYLVIQGNFTRKTGSNQSSIEIDNGNVYIFGNVDGWQDTFDSCTDYPGGTTGVAQTDCDYGSEDNFEENFETFPPEVAEKLNCFNLGAPTDQVSCSGKEVTFTSDFTTDVPVIYQWQVKTATATGFTNIAGANSSTLTLQNITDEMSGNLYRLKVKPSDNNTSSCKISISEPAQLLIETVFNWTGTLNANWNDASNWSCGEIPNASSDITIPAGSINNPVIGSGAKAMVYNLTVADGAVLSITANALEVYGSFTGTGKIDASLGTIVMKGTSPQVIPADLFLNNEILNLEIDNLQSVRNSSVINLSGWLKLTNGNLETNNLITLLSSASQTALIDGSGNGEIIENITMQRFLDPAFGYKYFGAPFNNSVISDFSSYVNINATFPSVYAYNESRTNDEGSDLSGWEAIIDGSASMNVLKGYALNFGENTTPVNVEIIGTVNNGELSRTFNTTNGTFTKGFHLVSNPYPSPINWDLIPSLSTNVDGAAYFFRADAADVYGGAYTSYVADISSSGLSGNIIPSMQGFFIHASEGSTSSILKMNNEVRVVDFAQDFYKNQKDKNSRKLIRLSAGYENSNTKDPLVIYFDHALASKFENKSDALKLYNSNPALPNFYSLTTDGKETSINGLPIADHKENSRIPLGLALENSGSVIIELQDFENFTGNEHVYLIDQDRRVSVDLKENAYKLQLDKGTYSNRFFISLTPHEFVDPSILFDDAFSLKNNSEEIGIRMNLKKGETGQLRISTISGQILKLIPVKENEDFSFKDFNTSGIYLVTFISSERQFSKKVIVRK